MKNSTRTLALFATLLTTFDAIHPACDQWLQNGGDATNKGAHGDHLVYTDGVAVGTEPDGQDRTGQPTMTATQLGRRAATRHVATYTLGQTSATLAVTRALGYHLPLPALLAGAAINGLTHYVIDRREPLLKLARVARKTGYIEHCQALRHLPDGSIRAEQSGPGTALMELDQALHRAIGITAAAVTAWLAVRANPPGSA